MGLLIGRMLALTISVCAIIISAAIGAPGAHMAASGMVSLAFALLAIWDNAALRTAGANKSAIASSTARHFGYVWAWGALGILITYAIILEGKWPEWWQFAIGFTIAAMASLIFSNMLARDAEEGKEDPALLKTGRTLVIVQSVAVIAGLISMFVDGKFPRDPNTYTDWAGCNIFFFGGLAVLAIGLNALRNQD